MIWVSWRQHRAAVLVFTITVAAAAAYVLVTGLRMRSSFDTFGLEACAAPVSESCPAGYSAFMASYSGIPLQLPVLAVLPALIGLLVGAPLVAQEIEHGTHRLAWTQSVSHRRWLWTKVGLLATVIAAGLLILGLLVHWCVEPLIAIGASSRLDPMLFTVTGIAPAAYGLVALAIGVTAGALCRRLVPAILVTLVAFTALWLGVGLGLRAYYAPPASISEPVQAYDFVPSSADNGLGRVVGTDYVSSTGQQFAGSRLFPDWNAFRDVCTDLGAPMAAPDPDPRVMAIPPPECLDQLGLQRVTYYHPEDAFWRFQLHRNRASGRLGGRVARHRVGRDQTPLLERGTSFAPDDGAGLAHTSSAVETLHPMQLVVANWQGRELVRRE